MMDLISYTTVATMTDAWEECRRATPDFDEEFGQLALEQMLLLEPSLADSTVLKAAGIENSSNDPTHFKVDAKSARAITDMVDSVVQMMGPDIDFVQTILANLGARYLLIGGNKELLPNIGLALCMAMELTLKRDMTDDEKEAFDQVYDSVSHEIVKSMS